MLYRVTDELGLEIDFELLANIDEDYGEHAVLRIARSEGARSVQEARYNVVDYGGDLEGFGSAAEADEEGPEPRWSGAHLARWPLSRSTSTLKSATPGSATRTLSARPSRRLGAADVQQVPRESATTSP